MTSLIPPSYAASRDRFRSMLGDIALRWPAAAIDTRPIGPTGEDLSIDILHAPATGPAQHLLVMTAGEHGIEGFVGSAIMQLAIRELLTRLDPRVTSLCLVHVINPWGMSHEQRTNAANADLNRNFLTGWSGPPPANTAYRRLRSMFQPSGPMPAIPFNRLLVAGQVMRLAITGQSSTLRQALLAGQYEEPDGLYYGGTAWQEETLVMRKLYDECLHAAPHVVHIDLHTGYGPRGAMSVVNSELDPVPSAQWAQRIDYPRVVAATSQEFYHIEGDMIDYLYRTRKRSAPTVNMYATCFEFGCLGDSVLAEIDSVWRTVASNRVRQHGALSDAIAREVHGLWREAYCPSEPSWEQQAHLDALRALRGILHDQGLMNS